MDKIKKLTEVIRKEVDKIILEEGKKNPKAKKSKKSPKMKFEGLSVESAGHVDKDDIGSFWVVTLPKRGSTDENIMFETDIFNFTEKVKGGLALETIKGIFRSEDRAKRVSGKLLRERESAINSAKGSAEKLKGLRDEVINKSNALKQTKAETIEAVNKLKESIKESKTPPKPNLNSEKYRDTIKNGNFDKTNKIKASIKK